MLILASASEARARLLREAGVRIRIAPARVRELKGRGRTLRETVLENARRKAAAVPGALVLAADTMIEFRGRICGKPRSIGAAVALLAAMAGRKHTLGTGVVLRRHGKAIERYVETKVVIRPLGRAAIARLLRGYDPTKVAGGYVIRKRDPLIERIEGSFSNVEGLPMEVVRPLLHGPRRRLHFRMAPDGSRNGTHHRVV